MVDVARLRFLLDRIGEETRHLRRLADQEPALLRGDPDKLAAVKYRFIVAIEAAIDACQHVIASEGLRAPTDFADSFAAVGEAGLLDEVPLDRMQDMARFRNLLVHGYARVDDDRVVSILRTRLDDLDAFRRALARTVTE